MTPKLTILATSLFVAFAQAAGASPMMSLPWAAADHYLDEWSDFALALASGNGRTTLDYSILTCSLDSFSTLTTATFSANDASTVWSLAGDYVPAMLIAAGEVQPELTPLPGSDAALALRRAWKRAHKQLPSLDLLAMLTAHWAHETADGVSMFNYNFGGIKGRGPDGLNCLRQAREGFGYRTRVKRDRFRAYPNAASGADDYLSLLVRKYPTAIEAAARGDVPDFVLELHRGGYFTGSEEAYARSVCKRTVHARTWAFSALRGLRSIDGSNLSAITDPAADEQFGIPLPLNDRCEDVLLGAPLIWSSRPGIESDQSLASGP